MILCSGESSHVLAHSDSFVGLIAAGPGEAHWTKVSASLGQVHALTFSAAVSHKTSQQQHLVENASRSETLPYADLFHYHIADAQWMNEGMNEAAPTCSWVSLPGELDPLHPVLSFFTIASGCHGSYTYLVLHRIYSLSLFPASEKWVCLHLMLPLMPMKLFIFSQIKIIVLCYNLKAYVQI